MHLYKLSGHCHELSGHCHDFQILNDTVKSKPYTHVRTVTCRTYLLAYQECRQHYKDITEYLHSPTFSLDEPIWTNEVHTSVNETRSRDVTDNWNRLLAGVTFVWRHVVSTAVERNDKHIGL